MRTTTSLFALLAGAAVALPGAANAQSDSGDGMANASGGSTEAANIVALEDFDPTTLEDGYSAREVLEQDVYGNDGEEIGEVQNLIIGTDNAIDRVIVEAGGLLDIGDTTISIPFEEISVTPDQWEMSADINEDNVEDYTIFGDDSTANPLGDNYRVTDVLDDYVRLTAGGFYGYVKDIVFDDGGALQTAVISPDVGYGTAGTYAYPYYGYGIDGYSFTPYEPVYVLPYTAEEAEGAPQMEGSEGSGSGSSSSDGGSQNGQD